MLDTAEHTLSHAEWLASQPLPPSDRTHIFNKVNEAYTWTEYHTLSQGVVTATSAQSRIVAGGNVDLFGSLANKESTIAAGGMLDVNLSGIAGTSGLVHGNENVVNQALSLDRTIQKVAVLDHVGCGWQTDWCTPDRDKEYVTRTPDTNTADYIHDHYTALGAVMSGHQGVSISGVNVSNGGVTAGGQRVDASHLDGNAQGIALHASGQAAVASNGGIGLDAQVDPATGHAPQVLGGVGQPLTGVTLPTTGIYHVAGGSGSRKAATPSSPGGATVSADARAARGTGVPLLGNAYLSALLGHAPSTNYLIETDPRFANYSQFISSDYLLQRLGLNPAQTEMRLGDGFYEQQLVVDQVTQLTGRTYLSDYSSGLSEYQALMDAGANQARALNLSVGVALTADQVDALTQSIVWLVQQNVDGHQVLVPVVYLAGGGNLDV